MELPDWMREAVDGYRWLWRAQLRWGRGPRWMAGLEFAVRVTADLGRGALTALRAGATPRAGLAPAGLTIDGRTTMAIPHPDPARAWLDDSANERLKAAFDSWLWTSVLAAVVIHFATFAFWPEMTAADISIDRDGATHLEPLGKVDIPPAPEPLSKPALPVAAPVDVGDDLTIGRTTFDHNPVDDLPPPPSRPTSRSVGRSGFFPFTVAPRVLNADEVVRAMTREYPTVLRNAGIGGTVSVNFAVDEDGRVLETSIGESSGYGALDEAALAVADVIRFSPAMNGDRHVAVRVAFPIVFRVDDRE